MTFKVTLKRPDGTSWTELAVDPGRAVLDVALAAGIDYPHGCRSGNCGSCKSYLIAGEVELAPYSDYALTAEERSRGLVLACRTVPWSDCVLQPVPSDDAAVHGSRRLDCRVVEISAATHDIRIVRLQPVAGGRLDYTAGQYAELTFDGLPPRDFSMATAPGADVLEFHIRLSPGGLVTSHVLEKLTVGDPVELRGPMGTAHYRASHRGPMLLLAGGSGLAPIKAIAEGALADGARQDMYLYFGARAERDVYLEDHFKALADRHGNLTYVVVLSEPTGDTDRRTGMLAEAVAADFADLDGFKAYLAGPPPMVDSCIAAVTDKGLARRDCHADAFYTEAEKRGLR